MLLDFLTQNNYEYQNDLESLLVYNYDAYLSKGDARLIIFPQTNPQLVQLLTYCNSNNIAYLIRAAGTNYCGSVQPTKDDVVISTLKLPINIVQEWGRLYTVSPNIGLGHINEKVKENNKFYPPDPSSHAICTIGGNIATNAGGAKCYMYGVTSNYVRELKIHTPRHGELLVGSKSLYTLANNALKHIIIGSEGTLATILEATISTQNRVKFSKDLVLTFQNYRNAIMFVYFMIDHKLLTNSIDMSTDPFIPSNHIGPVGAKLIIGIEHDDKDILRQKLDYLSNEVLNFHGEVKSEGDLHDLRRNIVKNNVNFILSNTNKKKYFLFDTVIPRSQLGEILEYFFELSKIFNLPLLNTYHAGDGNIHPTVFYDPESENELEALQLFLYLILRKAKQLGGALTGEHGIGIEKQHLQYIFSADYHNSAYEFLKDYFDPNGILNRGKLLSDHPARKIFIETLTQIQGKYGIDGDIVSEKRAIYNVTRNDGLIEMYPNQSVIDVNRCMENSGMAIPYFPMINGRFSISEMTKLGIPSFLDNYYNLETMIRALEFDNGKTIGEKTLKNVEGYNLVPLCAMFKGIKRFTVKSVFLEELMTRFFFYKIHCTVQEVTKIINSQSLTDYLIDYYYHSNGELIVMLSNAVSIDSSFTKFDIFAGENFGEFNTFVIASLEKSVDLSKLKFDKWIYLNNENCLIIYDDHIQKYDLEPLFDCSYSVREINDKSSRYIFLKEELNMQIHIQEKIEWRIKNELFELC